MCFFQELRSFVPLTWISFCLLCYSLSQAQTSSSPPATFQNPILSGFHPDPSICRVGDDYYLVNSSFEWFPGLPIYHSKDLVNWKLIGYGLSRPEQVNFAKGMGDSRGIYAPTLRYHDGLFYLITTCVQCDGNFYMTAPHPAGPWSDPVWLHSQGIDPSLFWENGKCYYIGHANISGKSDWPDKNGVWMQELDLKQKKLVGKRVQLTHGHATNARWTEGPHLYKIKGKYLLLVAEGGTGFHHSVTVHHSDSLWGPYIPDHTNPVLTHRNLGKDYPIHSVGHADLVQTPAGDWWAVMLAKRQVQGKTLLSRETFLTPVSFEDNTPVFNPGIGKLLLEQKRPDLPWTPVPLLPEKDDFTDSQLSLVWNMLRTPHTTWYNIQNGNLSLKLRPEMVDSLVNPSLIARRIQDYAFTASTRMTFTSRKANEQAGLILYRKSTNHLQLLREQNSLVLFKTSPSKKEEVARVPYSHADVILQAESDGIHVVFRYGRSTDDMKQIGTPQPITILSDEAAAGFNGPFIGMYATSQNQPSRTQAVFDWFVYQPQP